MLLDAVAATSTDLTGTPARSGKIARLAELLAATDPAEAAIVVSWLTGELTQRQIGVGWASLRELPPPAPSASLTVSDAERSLTLIGATEGAGSQARRRAQLDALFAAATEGEQSFLRRLLGGELRQGALAGVMADAVARAAGVAPAEIRRAAMLQGDLAAVAATALSGGLASLAGLTLQIGRPLGPMLAQTATGTDAALERLGGTAAFEWKLDGVRLQIHRDLDRVSLFTRTLDDITARLPEVAAAVRSWPGERVVLDAELIAVTEDGRPQPFQVTASRASGRGAVTPYVFDVLHADGADLLDEPASARSARLGELVPAAFRIPRLVTDDPIAARDFLADALAHGHEGVVAKSLTAPYSAGRRGAGWLKVKPVHTLDLVVLAVEQGSGRRRGWLSNIHLGARDPATGGFVMLGKTFKGMTDAMLQWQTARFTELADGPADGWVVRLRPEQVVEIAFDGIQRSTRYPGGVALRFARVLRYRDDKTAAEADTIDAVRAFGRGLDG